VRDIKEPGRPAPGAGEMARWERYGVIVDGVHMPCTSREASVALTIVVDARTCLLGVPNDPMRCTAAVILKDVSHALACWVGKWTAHIMHMEVLDGVVTAVVTHYRVTERLRHDVIDRLDNGQSPLPGKYEVVPRAPSHRPEAYLARHARNRAKRKAAGITRVPQPRGRNTSRHMRGETAGQHAVQLMVESVR